jgi:hypothetical protein
MSLTSYQAAPPRTQKIGCRLILRNEKSAPVR